MDIHILFLPVDMLFYFQQYPHDLAPISVELCYGWPVYEGLAAIPDQF
jgi:hypothetical protein